MNALNFLPMIEAEVIRGIRVNVSQGLNADGTAMAPYVRATTVARMRMGLSTTVNLRVKTSDSMLDTLGAEKIDANHSVISVRADKEGQAEGLSKKRSFMGVTPNALVRIEQRLEDEFIKAVK
jgi:hypothetical protein